MRVYLRTYGCRANQYDTEQVRAVIEGSGGVIVDDPADADAAVFNSCAVTTEAEVELRKGIRSAARQNGGLHTVVMGCAAALDRGQLEALPTVAGVVAGGDVQSVAASLGLPPMSAAAARQQSTRALLRIQDGCDEHCTFCATTLARGANRSRPIRDVVGEALRLAERHPEIVLTGIHIGTWGRDLGLSLGSLVAALVRGVPAVRFRLSSVEATEVDDDLARCFEDPARLAPHLHAPLQSGSDRLLRRMGRHWYTAARYAEAVERLVGARPVFGLGADVIAGFPGETEDDHQETLSLVRGLPFTYLHVFPYSARPGTAATRLPDPVHPTVIRRRAAELRAAGARAASQYQAGRTGARADVIVVRGDRREGLTEDYLVVDVASALPRGSRFVGRLGRAEGRLCATPVES
jgi:threonylcarbamoyladenosine tRNA methylthiotransferase MtaB